MVAEFCATNGIRRSMGRTGTCYDCRRVGFRDFKKELIDTKPWPTLKHLGPENVSVDAVYHNTRSRHYSIGYLIPVEYESRFRKIHEPAA